MIRVLLTKADTKLGKLITYFTKGKYSHSAILVNDMIFEAQIFISDYFEMRDGVFVAKKKNSIMKEFAVFALNKELTKDQENKVYEYCMRNIGRRYNIWLLMALAFIYPFKSWFIKHPEKIPYKQEFYGFICTEFVAKALNQADIDLCPGIDYNLISPDDIANSKELRKLN